MGHSQSITAKKTLENNACFLEIIVVENFRVENGLLGLDRDCYLSLVKFLNSLILRKVWVNTFVCYFNFFVIVHWY